MTIQPLSILKLSHSEALTFFMKNESYFSADMPPYFDFSPLLLKIKEELSDTELSDIMTKTKVWNYENVNHIILMNKDGKLSWRPLQLIHPVLYVNLVREITKKDNWEKLKARFCAFKENKRIQCLSIPVISPDNKKDRAAQISRWWQKFELRSIELSLEYDYIYETDVSECYSSIYTHSIAWAVETKNVAKKNQAISLLGNFIDKSVQQMQYGQTNGIPQGSTLMDFIAEIVLGYVDSEISIKLQKEKVSDYMILRYRDDFRIFVNNPPEGERILKCLSEVLTSIGLKLNSSKTKFSGDVVFSSVKADKHAWITSQRYNKDLLKQCLLIKQHALQHPNSGSLSTALSGFQKRISRLKHCGKNNYSIISIIADIAYRNPRVYPVSFAIISKLISLVDNVKKRNIILKKIHTKFSKLIHIGYMEIWFQRMIKSEIKELKLSEKLCKILNKEKTNLWNSQWINSKKINHIMTSTLIYDEEIFDKLDHIINALEYDLYPSQYQ